MKSISQKLDKEKAQDTILENAKVTKKKYVRPVVKVFVIENENSIATGSNYSIEVNSNYQPNIENWEDNTESGYAEIIL